jgi:hypothetical protein
MVMKMASFLRCGVVIVLSIVAGRAGAQNTFNGEIHIANVCSSCQMNVTTMQPGTDTTVTPYGGQLCVGFSGYFNYSMSGSSVFGDLSGGYPKGSFDIDTANRFFRNVKLTNLDQSNWYGALEFGAAVAVDQISILFDSIPYSDSEGVFISSGIFPCKINFFSMVTNNPQMGGLNFKLRLSIPAATSRGLAIRWRSSWCRRGSG